MAEQRDDIGIDDGGVTDERAAFGFAPAKPAEAAPPTSIEVELPERNGAVPAKSDRRRMGLRLSRPLVRQRVAEALVDEAQFGTPFLLVPVGLLIGVTVYFSLPAEPAPHNIPAAMAALALAWFGLRRRGRLARRVVLAGLITLSGMALAQGHTHIRGTQMLGSEVTTNLTGRIVRIEHRANGSARYTLDVIRTERPHLRYAPDRLRVTARQAIVDARVGDGLAGLARLRPHSGPARPGGYDFAFHGYFAGHGANGFFYGPPDKVAVPPAPGLAAAADRHLQNARLWLAARIRSAAPGEAGIVSAALVTGHKSAIPEEVNEALRVSGLAHILSISGLHMALVAGTVMIALRAVFAVSGGFASAHATRKYAAAIAFGAIFIYLFLAGASVATQRSFIMLAVMLGALMIDRAAISKRNLAIAAIIVIALFPSAAIGPSFHMSFAATLALIALYDIWNRARATRLRRQPDRLRPTGGRAFATGTGRFFAALAATSIVAGVASGFFAAYHFQRVAVLGLFTNLAAMPIVSLLTMPLAIIATLAIPFGLDGFLYAWMAQSAAWILTIAHWITDRSPAGMVGAMSNAAMIAATIALIWLCICRTWLRWGAVVPALVAVVLLNDRDLPLAVISEDGRQLAIIGDSGALAVNRSRPSAFITEQWQMAYAAPEIIKPVKIDDPLGDGVSLRSNTDENEPSKPEPMTCSDRLCTARIERDGHSYTLAIATEPDVLTADHCSRFDAIILAYAPASPICDADSLVLTAQDLALAGSAEIFAANRAGTTARTAANAQSTLADAHLTVRHAVSTPFRPWHDHRRFSRSARNLASR